MSSKKLCLAVSTYIQQKTLFPRRILTYSDFLGQTSVVNCDNIDVRNLLWSKAGQEQKIEMLRAWDYSSFKTATNKEEINQLLSWGVELHMELELLLQGNLFDREILGNLDVWVAMHFTRQHRAAPQSLAMVDVITHTPASAAQTSE